MLRITDDSCYTVVTSRNVIDVVVSMHEVLDLKNFPRGDGKRYAKIPGWFKRKLVNSEACKVGEWPINWSEGFEMDFQHVPMEPRTDREILIGEGYLQVWDIEIGYADQFKQTIHCLSGLG
jgi:hypothetical protein